MNTKAAFDRCLNFINCQLQSTEPTRQLGDGLHRRSITISRQAGSGAHVIAEKVAGLLQDAQAEEDKCPWTVFDRNLVEKVLEDHNLPSRLGRFMREDRITELSDTMDELFGLHPPSWTLVKQSAETILRLAELGNVILIGRGATVITTKLKHVFHVRLVGSIERRTAHLQEYYKLSKEDAVRRVHEEDRGRARYLKKYFGKDINDPLLYHLIINTDLIPYDDAARLVANAILQPASVTQSI